MLCSSGDGGKWILFFVDRVNVENFWGSSLRIVDGVTQLCRSKSQRGCRQRLTCTQQVSWRVRLSFLLYGSSQVKFFSSGFSDLLPDLKIFRPLLHSNGAIYRGFRGECAPLKTLHNGVNFPRYVGRDWPHNQGSYNWDAGFDQRALALQCWLRGGFWPTRLGAAVLAETRVSTHAPWRGSAGWDAGFDPRALVLLWWLWLALRLELGTLFFWCLVF